MDILFYNFEWMGVNVFLACLAVIFGYLAIQIKNEILKIIFSIFWIIFIPNTIYLITDIRYLSDQFIQSDLLIKFILIIQYLVLSLIGVISYFSALYPIEGYLKRKYKNLDLILLMIGVNFIISFGVFLGRVQRTESWDILLNPIKVVTDITKSLNSPDLLIFLIPFSILINFIYFYLKNLSKGLRFRLL